MKKEMIFVPAIILSLSFANFALAIDDPVAHWKLDEVTGTTAYDSAGDNDGNLINGPNWTTGFIDGALEFDGFDDYVDVNPVGELDFERTEAYTLSAWYKGVAEQRTILSKMDKSISYRGYDMYISSGYVQAHIISNWRSNAICETGTLYPINDFIWHHIVITYDGSSSANGLKIYIDGMEEITTVDEDSLSSTIQNSVSFKIAARGGTSTSAHLGGKIDDVRIYGRALSAAEIEELYLGEEAELVGLEITGPDEVAEDSQTQYSAIALYDNNSTTDVTDDAVWSVEPNEIAGIEAGLLATEKIFQPEELEIYAQYTEDGNTFEANKPVSVFAICPSGSALQFDGVDDYVNLGIDPNLQPALSVTISAWVKLENLGQDQYILDLDKELGWHSGIWLFVRDENNLTIGYGDGGSSSPLSRRAKIGTSALDAGIWYHIAAVLRGPTDLTLYINGEDDGGGYSGSGGNLTYRNKESFIGTLSTSRHFLDGAIDDMCLYNRALSAQEIQMAMLTGPAADEPNLLAYWNFDEGSGQVAYDTSGNANDGQLGSSPDTDDSDPNWVDSDAPVGICTLQELVDRNVSEALEIKLNILDEILEALAREDSSLNILDGLFGELDYGYLDKSDIRRARQKIHSAIQSEEQATGAIEKSIEKLDISLNTLDGE